MNVIYLHCHDAGRWLSSHGYAMPTPNLRQFAEESILFRNAHCANPTCSPSRACLLTGQWAHEQMFGLAHRGWGMIDPSRHLGNFLQGQGFHTVLSGIQHEFGTSQEGFPYEEVLETGIEDKGLDRRDWDPKIGRAAADFLKTYNDPKPFFLSCGFFFPHREFPHFFGEKMKSDHVHVPGNLPDHPETREDVAGYQAAVATMDRAAGEVLEALRHSPHASNTLVFFTTDHGPAFPGMKCTLKDAGTGVTLAFKVPGGKGGRVSDALVSQVDVFPTLCELLELPRPDWLRGQSFAGLLDTPEAEFRDVCFGEVNFHASYEPQRSIRTNRYKLIVHYDREHETHPMANIDPGNSKAYLLDHGLAGRRRHEVELYDLVFDPHEVRNLAGEPEYADVRSQLEQRLKEWQQETSDPILKGPIAPPPGAIIDPHEAVDYS